MVSAINWWRSMFINYQFTSWWRDCFKNSWFLSMHFDYHLINEFPSLLYVFLNALIPSLRPPHALFRRGIFTSNGIVLSYTPVYAYHNYRYRINTYMLVCSGFEFPSYNFALIILLTTLPQKVWSWNKMKLKLNYRNLS